MTENRTRAQNAAIINAALGTTLDALHDDLVMFPQTLVNVRVTDKKAIAVDPEVQAAVQRAEERLHGKGRVNLRPSGTENLIRVMVEGQDETEIHEIARELAGVVETRGALTA